MDSHSHPSLARGNAAGSNLLAHETNTKPVVVNASAASTNVENASQSPSASHSHQHHQHHHHPNHPHHQFVESSPVYHHPFRTITPNSAETNNKILDSHPQSKSSTPTNQQQSVFFLPLLLPSVFTPLSIVGRILGTEFPSRKVSPISRCHLSSCAT
ncbi:hypothetical protein MJO29_001574 [Puccinia striiformis f. sp. tritici]|nr:hypothetical protein MJO29_001574 [Puccinia striiformis f. sp. tritici]